jgi:DNA-binding NarL/FixJ family response regulator
MNTVSSPIQQSGGAVAHSNQWSSERPIRAFLADESPFMLVFLSRILAGDRRITVVGSATDGRKAFHMASSSHPDLVLMALHMHGFDGAEVTRWLKKLRRPPVVFVVTSDDSGESQARTLRAGADAYLLKTENLALDIQTAIGSFFGSGRRLEHKAVCHGRNVITARA